jgi:guanine nucleotide-binding protein G(i) subunit alpha
MSTSQILAALTTRLLTTNLESEMKSPNATFQESLGLFHSLTETPWFTGPSMVLFLSNMSAFQQRLKRYPLGNSCPNYTGGDDVDRAAEYILGLFKSANRANLSLNPHVAEPDDHANMHRVFGVV